MRISIALAIFCHRVSCRYGWGELGGWQSHFCLNTCLNKVYGGCSSNGCRGWLSVVAVSCVLHGVVPCWPPHPGLRLPAGPCQALGLTQNLSLLKGNWLKIPLLYSLFVFLSQPGVFHVDHKFLHPFFSPSKCVHGWCGHLSKYLSEALSPPLLLWAFWMSCIEEYFAEVYFSWQ